MHLPFCIPTHSCTFAHGTYTGYGVYRTEEDCLNAPQTEGEGDVGTASVSSASIDPYSYHEPTVEGSQCWDRETKTNEDACPHFWPDVKLWCVLLALYALELELITCVFEV